MYVCMYVYTYTFIYIYIYTSSSCGSLFLSLSLSFSLSLYIYIYIYSVCVCVWQERGKRARKREEEGGRGRERERGAGTREGTYLETLTRVALGALQRTAPLTAACASHLPAEVGVAVLRMRGEGRRVTRIVDPALASYRRPHWIAAGAYDLQRCGETLKGKCAGVAVHELLDGEGTDRQLVLCILALADSLTSQRLCVCVCVCIYLSILPFLCMYIYIYHLSIHLCLCLHTNTATTESTFESACQVTPVGIGQVHHQRHQGCRHKRGVHSANAPASKGAVEQRTRMRAVDAHISVQFARHFADKEPRLQCKQFRHKRVGNRIGVAAGGGRRGSGGSAGGGGVGGVLLHGLPCIGHHASKHNLDQRPAPVPRSLVA